MIAAVDNTFLTLLLNPSAAPRPNPVTGLPVPHCRERIDAMIDQISAKKGTLYVPAPALAEALCTTDAAEAYFDQLQSYSCIEIAHFDGKAAYELGRVVRAAKVEGDKRSGEEGNWQYVKMDRAIVAIAVALAVDTFYSDDRRQKSFAKLAGLIVKSTWDLPLPPEYAQTDLGDTQNQPWPRESRRIMARSGSSNGEEAK